MRRQVPGRLLVVVVLLAAATAPFQSARAVNTDPGDYVALPAGTNFLLQYLQYGNDTSINIQGTGSLPAHLNSEIGLFRAVHYDTLFGVIVDPQIIIPYGSLRNAQIDGKPQNSSSGLGGPIVAVTFWPINRPDTATYFGITPYIILPFGAYRRTDGINLGNNRTQGDLQLGFQSAAGSGGLAKQFVVTLYVDAEFSDANTDSAMRSHSQLIRATLTQSTSYQLQSWLTYTTGAGTGWSVGYSATAGGHQSVGGLPNGFRTEEQQVRFEVQRFVTQHWQLMGELTHDVHVVGGFRQEIGANARIGFVF